jgi:hypothetical protein
MTVLQRRLGGLAGRRVLLLAGATALLGAVGLSMGSNAGNQEQNATLEERVEALEKTVAGLEKRVAALEKPEKPEKKKPKGKSAWEQLRKGMSADEVRDLLGEPDDVSPSPWGSTTWKYGHFGRVTFDDQMRVTGWARPPGP